MRQAAKGSAGFDNARENIDPHVRTKALSTKEVTLSDGSVAGYVKNDANGVLSGGNAGSAAGAVEGTAVLSTGPELITKFLRSDGDGTCSWQVPSGSGDVTAAVALTDVTLVQGDGGAKGVKTTTVTATEVAANTLKTGITAGQASAITANTLKTGITSGQASAITANTAKDTNVSTNITIVEAPTNVSVQSSDGSNDTIAAADVTNAGVMTTTMYDEHVVNTAHAIDSTQAHSDYLLNNASDTTSGTVTAAGFTTAGVTVTGDHGTATTDQVVNVCYGTSETPPTASNTTEGTLYIQYTA